MKLTRLVVLAAALSILALAGCSKDDDSPTSPGGGTPNPGSVTFSSGNFASGVFVHTFTTDGTYDYRCTLHASMGMTGQVVVSAAGADSPNVTINSHTFGPATVNVKTGSYVKWVNGGAAGTHNVTRP